MVSVSDNLTLTPTYGVGWCREQSAELISQFCVMAGFQLEGMEKTDKTFLICLKKAIEKD